MLKLFDKLTALPAWLRAGRSDLESAHQRRQSPAYRHRVRRAKTLWLVAAGLIGLNPTLEFVALVVLITTLLSFAILDESD